MRLYFPLTPDYKEPDVDRIKTRVTSMEGDTREEKNEGISGVEEVKIVDGPEHLECIPEDTLEPEVLMIRCEYGAGPYELLDDQLRGLLMILQDELLEETKYGSVFESIEFIIRE